MHFVTLHLHLHLFFSQFLFFNNFPLPLTLHLAFPFSISSFFTSSRSYITSPLLGGGAPKRAPTPRQEQRNTVTGGTERGEG